MSVYFIGAGPGDPELLTIKAQRILAKAGLCLYPGSFIGKNFVKPYLPPKAELVDTANLDLTQIIDYIKGAYEKGQIVARLHSGDPSLYSAMGEQIASLSALKIPYEIIPGVPAFCAAAAAIGQELTQPFLCQSLVITRVARYATPVPKAEDLSILGQARATMVLYLSIKNVEEIYQKLLPLYGADCPVIIGYAITHEEQKIFKITLGQLVDCVRKENLRKTAIIFIGKALKPQSSFIRAKLYQKNNDK